MPVLQFKKHDGSFDPETTRLMGRAFDAACALFVADLSKNDQEAIADAIIVEAKRGERDPIRLRDAGTAALKPKLR